MDSTQLQQKVSKDLIIGFILGIVFLGLIWIIVAASVKLNSETISTNQPTLQQGRANIDEIRAEAQQRRQVMMSGQNNSDMSGARIPSERTMPWEIAQNFLKIAPVKSVKQDGLKLTITMNNGESIIVTEQPKKDAYVAIIKESKSTIEVLK